MHNIIGWRKRGHKYRVSKEEHFAHTRLPPQGLQSLLVKNIGAVQDRPRGSSINDVTFLFLT